MTGREWQRLVGALVADDYTTPADDDYHYGWPAGPHGGWHESYNAAGFTDYAMTHTGGVYDG